MEPIICISEKLYNELICCQKYAHSDLIEKAHESTDQVEIELLINYSKSCGLFEVDREIIEAWEVRQKELIAEMNFFWFEKLWPFKM